MRRSELCRLLALALVLGAMGHAAAADSEGPASARVRFELVTSASAPYRGEGSLLLVPVVQGERRGEPLTLSARDGSPAADLAVGSEWQVTAAVPGFWSRQETLVVAAPGEVAERITLWPLARVTGQVLAAEKDAPLPAHLTLATVVPPLPDPRRRAPVARVSCPIAAGGSFRCDFPAATVDLLLAAGSFVPAYRWGVALLPGQETALGSLALKRGASVVGWAEAEEGALDPAGCRARLVPLAMAGGDAAAAQRLASTALSASVGKDGFFQLAGVPPGSYRLEVSQPGYEPAVLAPLDVRSSGEVFVNRPLTLRRPRPLELAVEPPLDGLGKPWEIRLARRSEPGAVVMTGRELVAQVDEQGLAVVPEVTAGRFLVQVIDSRDNRLLAQEIELAGPADFQQTLRLALVAVRGRLRLGGEPLAATLWFGLQQGLTSVRMEADAEGSFQGTLTPAGPWPVEIEAVEPAVATRVKALVEPGRDGVAELAIDLPDTRVFGRVVESETKAPAAGADVLLQAGEIGLAVESDEQGRFEARAFSAGRVQLHAARGAAASDAVEVVVARGQGVGPLELLLRRLKPVAGKVVSSRGPLAGARVEVLPWRPALAGGDSATTDMEGSFTVHLPEQAAALLAVVAAPGYPLQVFEVAPGGAPLLRVGELGGVVEVRLPAGADDLFGQGVSLVLQQNGLPLTDSTLIPWTIAHGVDLSALQAGAVRRLPALAPGHYRACLVRTALLAEWLRGGGGGPAGRCAAGDLGAGETLTLDLGRGSIRGGDEGG